MHDERMDTREYGEVGAKRRQGKTMNSASHDVHADDGGAFLMPRHSAKILSVRELARGITQLVLEDAYVARHAAAGQFINLYTKDPTRMMPRPFGVSAVEGDAITLIFAVVGSGTLDFSRLRAGDSIDVLGPLGRGFDMSRSARYVLVGGGLGIPPLLYAAQQLMARSDADSLALLGYRDIRYADSIASRYCDAVRSIDESEGNVITLLNRHLGGLDGDECGEGKSGETIILSCGPHPMMKAVAQWASAHAIPSQLSLEARMGCGFGSCVACVEDTVEGRKKVCMDGPVFTADELGWAV
jgi:dihydroorotate dehydrogenase electron transfer subunit